jgi:hypothetical protein
MNEIVHHIRKAFLDRLSGNISVGGIDVSIYNVIPRNASYPLIRVYSVSNDEIDLNRSSFNVEASLRLEVITRFDGNSGGELQCNQIVDEVLNQIRTRSAGYIDISANGWNVYAITNNGVNYLEDDFDDHTYFRAVVNINVKAQKI